MNPNSQDKFLSPIPSSSYPRYPRDSRRTPPLNTSSYLLSPRSGTPVTTGNPDESQLSSQVPIPHPHPPGTLGTPGTPDESQRLRQVPISYPHPPGTPGTLGTPYESQVSRQVSYLPSLSPPIPQVSQGPQRPQMNPISQYKFLSTLPSPRYPCTSGTQGTPDESQLSRQVSISNPLPQVRQLRGSSQPERTLFQSHAVFDCFYNWK